MNTDNYQPIQVEGQSRNRTQHTEGIEREGGIGAEPPGSALNVFYVLHVLTYKPKDGVQYIYDHKLCVNPQP
jgi:hypothetical protein